MSNYSSCLSYIISVSQTWIPLPNLHRWNVENSLILYAWSLYFQNAARTLVAPFISVPGADKRASEHEESPWKIYANTAPTSWRPETAAPDAFGVSSLAGHSGC